LFNYRRLLKATGVIPSAEFEMAYYREEEESVIAALLKQMSRRISRGNSEKPEVVTRLNTGVE